MISENLIFLGSSKKVPMNQQVKEKEKYEKGHYVLLETNIKHCIESLHGKHKLLRNPLGEIENREFICDYCFLSDKKIRTWAN